MLAFLAGVAGAFLYLGVLVIAIIASLLAIFFYASPLVILALLAYGATRIWRDLRAPKAERVEHETEGKSDE